MTSFGMNLPLNFARVTGSPALDPYFTAAVDDIAAHGLSWVRFGVNEDLVLIESPGYSDQYHLRWQQASEGFPNLGYYDNAINYIRAKGLRIVLVLFPPFSFTTTYSETDYLNVISMWAGFLAQRWAGKIDVWEIGNEANDGDFRNRPGYTGLTPNPGGSGVPTLDPLYLHDLAGMLATARKAIRVYDQGLITTSTGLPGTIYDDKAQAQYIQFFGAISTSIDLLAMHIYDVWSTAPEIAQKIAYLNALTATFHKPIYLTEFGWPWSPAYGYGTTEAVQAQWLPLQVAGISQANIPVAIQYQYRDEDGATPSPNQNLGLVKNTGVHTLGYAPFFTAVPPAPPLAYAAPNTLEYSYDDQGGYDGDVLQRARFVQGAIAGTDLRGPLIQVAGLLEPPWAADNLFVNGGFEINSRGGTTFNATAGDTCPADGWEAASGVWTRETVIVDGGGVSLKCAPDLTNKPYLFQTIEDFGQFLGRTLSVRARVRGSSSAAIEVLDGFTEHDGPITDCSAGWTTLYYSTVLNPAATFLGVGITGVVIGGATFYVDNMTLTCTGAPSAYIPANKAIDSYRARARFWSARVSHRFRALGAGHDEVIGVRFPAAVTSLLTGGLFPNVTNSTTAPAVFTNVASAIVLDVDNQGALISITAAGPGDCLFLNQTFTMDAGVF